MQRQVIGHSRITFGLNQVPYQFYFEMHQKKDVGESETVLSTKVIEQILQLLLNCSHE